MGEFGVDGEGKDRGGNMVREFAWFGRRATRREGGGFECGSLCTVVKNFMLFSELVFG
jgi:hypothetical protein